MAKLAWLGPVAVGVVLGVACSKDPEDVKNTPPPAKCDAFDYSTFDPSAGQQVSFKKDLVPIIRRACSGKTGCHNSGGNIEAGLALLPGRFNLPLSFPFPLPLKPSDPPVVLCDNYYCEPGEPDGCKDCDTTCGDSMCSPKEGGRVCNGSDADCAGPCGNGVCGTTETEANCAQDCQATDCGDGYVGPAENAVTCPADAVAVCAQDCAATCGNFTCEESETVASCPFDCKPEFCGDQASDMAGCSTSENAKTCTFDCGACGDGYCGYHETLDCPDDCAPDCGNGVCDAGKTPTNCAVDCIDDTYCALHPPAAGATCEPITKTAYEHLVGVDPSVGVDAKTVNDDAWKLIVPGDPQKSFVMLKLDACQNALGLDCTALENSSGVRPPCGRGMPDLADEPKPGETPQNKQLKADERLLFRLWIAQGALYN